MTSETETSEEKNGTKNPSASKDSSNDEDNIENKKQPAVSFLVEDPQITSSSNFTHAGAGAAAAAAVEDLDGGNDNDGDDDCDDDDDEHDDPMPLLAYSRLTGSLPRNRIVEDGEAESNNSSSAPSPSVRKPVGVLSVPSTCSALGKIILDPTILASTEGGSSTSTASQAGEDRQRPELLLASDLWKQPHYVMALGMAKGGEVHLLNAMTGINLLPQQPQQQKLNCRDGTNHSNSPPTVDLCFDASGTFLAAIDAGGTCAIWEFKFAPRVVRPVELEITQEQQQQRNQRTSATQQQQQQSSSQDAPAVADTNIFSSFMSSLTGMPPPEPATNTTTATTNTENDITTPIDATTTTTTTDTNINQSGQPSASAAANAKTCCLTANIVQVSRIIYPDSFGAPTCMALDPAHKKRREKSIVVGFADGRLLLTKRGFLGRRTDAVIHQGAKSDESAYRGIETVAWRGSILAWADSSGIKLFDTESMTRIAGIAPPVGARASLYPTISALRPTLCFETNNHLLVAWGDCLLGIVIRTVIVNSNPAAANGDGVGQPTTPQKRQTVAITMAWELECIASGVVPLDEENVLVLGLVPPVDVDDETEEPQNDTEGNDLEVQIVSRTDGSVTYCDSLPMLKDPLLQQQHIPGNMAESASSYRLLSSFALSRMEDAAEIQEEIAQAEALPEDFDLPLFAASTDSTRREFRDSHRYWSLKSILFEKEELEDKSPSDGEIKDEHDSDSHSVDSDDYSFVLRPLPEAELQPVNTKSVPPIMAMTSGSDVVIARMASVDDAVAHALATRKCALALRRALRHKRELRRFKPSDLVNHYLAAVLRLPQQGGAGEDQDDQLALSGVSLSLRRLKLAVDAMPIILGGHIDLWERWTRQFETIPGGLLMLRERLPVRDPILPREVYERILEKMLEEVEQVAETTSVYGERDDVNTKLAEEAAGHFLSSLLAWGPTNVLREYIKLYKYIRDRRKGGESLSSELQIVEVSLQRRYLQTAAGYLQFPTDGVAANEETSEYDVPRFEADKDGTEDSLFDVSFLVGVIAPRAPLVSVPEDERGFELAVEPSKIMRLNSRTCLQAMARLRMMQGRFDLAFRCFLAIGALHSPMTMETIEASAIASVTNHGESLANSADSPILIGSSSYEFVLGMIEFHHLHRFLLSEEFIVSSDQDSKDTVIPLFALFRLLGIELMGEFLIEHCVSPEIAPPSDLVPTQPSSVKNDYDDMHRSETLPIDQVANQLSGRPALLHWYLHLVFTRKPEIYVKFPNTANPPPAVTDLHRKHFDLYLRFAGSERDSAKSLEGTEYYKADAKTTPLLSFLKAALPLGGIRPVDARRFLEAHRSRVGTESDEDSDDDDNSEKSDGDVDRKHNFSLELAYIIEHYSEETEAEATGILDLYLEGANSVMLAVSYAQRQTKYSAILWDRLISYCLSNDSEKRSKRTKGENEEDKEGESADGFLFGSLLEAAALSGADLARLVTKIPPGMDVEGLRPRLVAAVADYRFKVDIHEASAKAGTEDRLALLREITHRSRRGVRYQLPRMKNLNRVKSPVAKAHGAPDTITHQTALASGAESAAGQQMLTKRLRTVERRDRYSLAYSVPMR